MNKIKYVAGFLFSPDFYNVVLIEKKKPAWQAGKYNGIGGKVEESEDSYEAMIREFEEEAGLRIDKWNRFCIISDKGYSVDFFYTISDKWNEYVSRTEEEVFHIPVDDLHLVRSRLIENLSWLIPLAIDRANGFSEQIVETNNVL